MFCFKADKGDCQTQVAVQAASKITGFICQFS